MPPEAEKGRHNRPRFIGLFMFSEFVAGFNEKNHIRTKNSAACLVLALVLSSSGITIASPDHRAYGDVVEACAADCTADIYHSVLANTGRRPAAACALRQSRHSR